MNATLPRTITITDETLGSKQTHSFSLEFLDERITAKEFIRRRIYDEVMLHNTKTGEVYNGLVTPEDAERTLNGVKTRASRPLNWETQYQKALEAFTHNGFVMLADNKQLESLEEEFELREGSTVTFLKLVPLVGG
jgi:hypothetical protein